MFAHQARPRAPTGENWIHEPKLDGWRVQILTERRQARLLTRRGVDISHRVPRLIEAPAGIPTPGIIDGELTCPTDTSPCDFAQIPSVIRKGRGAGLAVWAFDLMVVGGRDIRHWPSFRRRQRLEQLLKDRTMPQLVATFADPKALMHAVEKLELEGIVSKRSDLPYHSRSSSSWIKSKTDASHAANAKRFEQFKRARQ